MPSFLGCAVAACVVMALASGASGVPEECLTIEEDTFGVHKDPSTGESYAVRSYTLVNRNNLQVKVIDYGATIVSVKTPDKNGKFADVVLGFDDVSGYERSDNPYFGATIGRVANRIENGTFQIGNQRYSVAKNVLGKHSLHGGERGFDKVMWTVEKGCNEVRMTYYSRDGESGFPGNVKTTVCFKLTNDNKLIINYQATADRCTPISLTNHAYFNLAGHNAGQEGLYQHLVLINADKYTDYNEDSVPTGEIKSVSGTEFDLRELQPLGAAIQRTFHSYGFDLNYVINSNEDKSNFHLKFTARVIDPVSGRYVDTFTDQPGVQFYTTNSLAPIPGKEGVLYDKHSAFCLETQKFPDALHHSNFPSIILNPHPDVYKHSTVYAFGVVNN
nr:PREDICTED: aldose 1-epimerase-like isoform X1 [Bemisia tabaci]